MLTDCVAKVSLYPTHKYLNNLIKRRYQRLRKPKAEDQFRARHEELRSQAFEETGKAFVFCHIAQDFESTLRVIEVTVLDASLNNVQGRRNEE